MNMRIVYKNRELLKMSWSIFSTHICFNPKSVVSSYKSGVFSQYRTHHLTTMKNYCNFAVVLQNK